MIMNWNKNTKVVLSQIHSCGCCINDFSRVNVRVNIYRMSIEVVFRQQHYSSLSSSSSPSFSSRITFRVSDYVYHFYLATSVKCVTDS